MKLNLKARDWHNWVSVILVVPMLMVGLTSLFLAHKKALDLNDIDVTRIAGGLPGYGTVAMKHAGTELRASLALPDGSLWVGTQAGLYRIAAGQAHAVPELGDTQVRDLAAAPWGIVAATKNGIWVLGRDGWRKTHKGDAWNAALAPDGSVAVAIKDKGLLVSRDGTEWRPHAAAQRALDDLPTESLVDERISLGKLTMDLHTGKAFFGKEAEWLWIDLLGATWVFLGFTGLWLWWRSQIKRRDAARNRSAAEAGHG